jgi:tRNA(Ile)-lysidine synthase
MLSRFPSPDLAERFRADLERLAGGAPEKIGIAVSGGPDSLALLLLARAAHGGRVEAATVDHQLRPESGAEAAFVAKVCADLGCAHSILAVEVRPGGDGVQGEARRARYAALAGWAGERGIATLCTAHHADDQAETMLMRLQRGSGVSGLSGIRAARKEGPSLALLRPLLGWTRAELGAVVQASGLTPIDDPSNRDTRFDRVTMRQFLRDNPRFEARRLSRSAAALAEAEQALEWSAGRAAAERCALAAGEWRIDASGLPREIRRRLLAGAIARIRGDQKVDDVEGLLCALEKGGTGTLAGVMASANGDEWRVRLAPPRRQPR